MTGSFFAINTALRGLQAQKKALEVSAHNVANANTPGYTRQQAIMAAGWPYTMPALNKPATALQIGTGVDVQEIRRIRDEFLDGQVRKETQSLGRWEVKRDVLRQVEVVFMEPGDTGLSSLFAQFWSSWQELSKSAESSPVRTTVRETALALAEAIRHSYQQLKEQQDFLDELLEIRVREVNSLAEQIARLNGQIRAVKVAGDQPNDLLDQRDRLIDELSRLINVKVTPELDDQGKETGVVTVSILDGDGGWNGDLVDPSGSHRLAVDVDDSGRKQVVWEETGAGVAVTNGEIMGILECRNLVLARYLEDLDVLAKSLINRVNELHKEGYDLNGNQGGAFFIGSSAADIDVDELIKSDVSLIAAATVPEAPGDGSNALRIAQLKNTRLERSGDELIFPESGEPGEVSIDDFYKNLIARLGVEAHEAVRMAENQEVLVKQLEERRDAVSAVSIDEEVAYMVQFERAYQACSRVITVLDEMLDTIINRMGRW